MKLKRSERMVVISNYLINNPYQLTSLNTFAERYEVAKSSISEDVAIIKKAFEESQIGEIETVTGASGGVMFTPTISDEDARSLKSGDYVYITGTIYTARDAAHKRMAEALERKEQLPIDMKNNIIYYMGPSPAREQRPIGSAGPTTASRMDKYAPDLLDLGLKGMIGKGKRSQAVIDGIVRNGAVYFAAVGGAGAILSKCIKKSTVIAYDDLGTEAIRELEVENLPVIVVIDSEGNNLYETAIKEYCRV